MKTAFTIFKYFPHGGLQLDFRRIAEECVRRGHDVTIYTRSWEGEPVAGAHIVTVPVHGLSNHAKAKSFERNALKMIRADRPDVICGFNRMTGLDIYFAADNCFAVENGARAGRLKRLLSGRYRVYEKMERAVFDPVASHARIMLLTERQREDFRRIYGTPDERFTLLPPGIDPARKRPEDETEIARRRTAIRAEFGIDADSLLLLQVCSGFATKGVDRTIHAVAALPEAFRQHVVLLIAGRENNPKFQQLTHQLGIAGNVIFAGGRNDIGALLSAADLMVHPARKEATGTVLAEALAAGLPVLCSGCCGYAAMVRESGGTVLDEPFEQQQLNQALAGILNDPAGLEDMRNQAVEYGKHADFYRRAELAATLIEGSAQQ